MKAAPVFWALSEERLMALTIMREAGGESAEGKIAVGTVILERVDHRKWDGKTIHEVCLMPWQFSCYNVKDIGYRGTLGIAQDWDAFYAKSFSLMDCYAIASGMLAGYIPRHPILAAAHCCQYLNPKVAPEAREKWIKGGMESILIIGRHEFLV